MRTFRKHPELIFNAACLGGCLVIINLIIDNVKHIRHIHAGFEIVIRQGNKDAVELFLRKFRVIVYIELYYIEVAVNANHLDIAEILLQESTNKKQTYLSYCCSDIHHL